MEEKKNKVVYRPGIPGYESGYEENKTDSKIEISNEKVLEDIKSILGDKERTIELAKKVEKSYITLYHDIYSTRELEKGTKIYSPPNDSITFEKNRKGNQYFQISHRNLDESSFGIFITIKEDQVSVNEQAYCFIAKVGTFEDVFKFYLRKGRERIAKRIKSLITMPQEILEAIKKRDEKLQSNGLETLLQQSEEKLFDIKVLKNSYYTNPKAFKQLFEFASDEQKKQVIQELIKTKEANKEVDKWIEENHEKLATTASRDHIYTK